MAEEIVAFTGHRPDKLGGYHRNPLRIEVCRQVTQALIAIKPDKAISGMALGFDQMAALACVALDIPFIAAVPFKEQASMWPDAGQRDYHWLLDKAAHVVVVSEGGYNPWKMQKRNEWMVDNCTTVLAAWNGAPGGTANCLKYAERKKNIWMLDIPWHLDPNLQSKPV